MGWKKSFVITTIISALIILTIIITNIGLGLGETTGGISYSLSIYFFLFFLYLYIKIYILFWSYLLYLNFKEKNMKKAKFIMGIFIILVIIFMLHSSYSLLYNTTDFQCNEYILKNKYKFDNDQSNLVKTKDICLINQAEFTHDRKICRKISEIDIKDRCYLQFMPDESLCSSIIIQKNKNSCYQQSSSEEEMKNGSVCGKIEGTSEIDSCYNNIAVSNENISFCLLIKSISEREKCVSKIGEKLLNSDICEMIKDEQIKKDCFDNVIVSIAQKSKDIETCNPILNLSKKEFCYDLIAINSGNKTICNMIVISDNYKRHCLQFS